MTCDSRIGLVDNGYKLGLVRTDTSKEILKGLAAVVLNIMITMDPRNTSMENTESVILSLP